MSRHKGDTNASTRRRLIKKHESDCSCFDCSLDINAVQARERLDEDKAQKEIEEDFEKWEKLKTQEEWEDFCKLYSNAPKWLNSNLPPVEKMFYIYKKALAKQQEKINHTRQNKTNEDKDYSLLTTEEKSKLGYPADAYGLGISTNSAETLLKQQQEKFEQFLKEVSEDIGWLQSRALVDSPNYFTISIDDFEGFKGLIENKAKELGVGK